MLSWAIQTTIISLVIIFLVHSIYTYLKETLTVPKVKDLVNKPNKKYDEILSTVQKSKNNLNKNSEKKTDTITSETKVNMKNQLHSFLNDLKKKNSTGQPTGQPIEFSLYK